MRAIADLTVVCAADANQLRAHPSRIARPSRERCTSGSVAVGTREVYAEVPEDFEIGRAERLRDGDDATIITTGSEVWAVLRAAERLAADGVHVARGRHAHVSPLDVEEVLAAGRETAAILTVEEHNLTGGLGTAVAETLMERGAPPLPSTRRPRRARGHRSARRAVRALPARCRRHHGRTEEPPDPVRRHRG